MRSNSHSYRDTVSRKWLPLIEAKMVHQYNHRWGTYAGLTDRPKNTPLPQPGAQELDDPFHENVPWYWIEEIDCLDLIGAPKSTWIICWRDGARNTDSRSLIAAVVIWGPIVGDLPTFSTTIVGRYAAALIANMNSIICDYCCRLKYSGGHIKQYHVKQLPVLPPSAFAETDLAFIVPRVLELTYTSHSMEPFAADLGYTGSPFSWNEDRRAYLRAEIDAKIAKLYGLTRDQLRYILDPADVYGPDYPSETFRVLKNNDIAKYGEYRTAKLVLDAWDRLERGELK